MLVRHEDPLCVWSDHDVKGRVTLNYSSTASHRRLASSSCQKVDAIPRACLATIVPGTAGQLLQLGKVCMFLRAVPLNKNLCAVTCSLAARGHSRYVNCRHHDVPDHSVCISHRPASAGGGTAIGGSCPIKALRLGSSSQSARQPQVQRRARSWCR